jgi:6-pyruvoyltetrahydropterin/6-carboxytetrahydropterin synthase
MFEISVMGRFTAAHQLRRDDGSTEPLHRHHWRVMVTLAGPALNDQGVLLDFGEIKPRLDELLGTLNDRTLNDLASFAKRIPSTENIALHVAERVALNLPDGVRLRCVEVEEAPGCVARFFAESP